MIKNEEQLKLLAISDSGKVLIDFLDDQIKQMTDITQIKTYEELIGKQQAMKILKELFNFLEKSRVKPDQPIKTDYK